MADPSKTEKATPKRKDELRRKGQTARSQELNTALTFLLAIVFMRFYLPFMAEFLKVRTEILWSSFPKELTLSQFSSLAYQFVMGLIQVMAPLFILLFIGALLVNIFQVGWLISFEPLKPDLTKINPVSGFKRLFSMQPLIMLAQNIFKIAIIVWLAYSVLSANYDSLLQTVQMSLANTGALIGSIIWELVWKIGLAMLLISLIDLAWQRWYFERNIRMSKQEVKDETKNAEGDPQIKSKIRQLQRKAALQRMMEAVPRADVVLTNPTHLAVAVEYNQAKMGAPQVTAKGANRVAERIKTLAREHQIPIIEDKPMARALFKVEIGDEIPADLYAAVSETLIYVYQLTGRIHEYMD